MKALAIDFGGTHATCALVEDRLLLAHERIDADGATSLNSLLPKVETVLRRLVEGCGFSFTDCFGLAVGFAGLVDSWTGRSLAINGKYEGAPEADLARWSRETFGLALRIENDDRRALLGEAYAGTARGLIEVVMMTLGTGIGGVAMIEGKLLRGKHAQAGCLGGHIPAVFNGRPCNCGAIGCAEAEASGWSLPLLVRSWPLAIVEVGQRACIGFAETRGSKGSKRLPGNDSEQSFRHWHLGRSETPAPSLMFSLPFKSFVLRWRSTAFNLPSMAVD